MTIRSEFGKGENDVATGGYVCFAKDIDYFFENAKEDNRYNTGSAQPYISKWGSLFPLISSAWVVDYMQRSAQFLDGFTVIASAIRNVCLAQSLFKEFGDKAASIALSGVISSTDEDVLAVDAYILASNEFADPKYCSQLRLVLDRVVGTSCKITVAYAIYKCGYSRELLWFFNQGYLCSKFMAQGLLESTIKDNPGKSNEEAERMVLDWHSIDGFPHVLGVFGILVLDNWTRGQFVSDGYLTGLPWTGRRTTIENCLFNKLRLCGNTN